MIVDERALARWNHANALSRQSYRVDQGLETLPGGLNYRPDGLHGRPVRPWLLDALADRELAEARARIAEAIAEAAVRELGVALMEIERLTGGKEQEDEAGALHGLRPQDQDHGVPEDRRLFRAV